MHRPAVLGFAWAAVSQRWPLDGDAYIHNNVLGYNSEYRLTTLGPLGSDVLFEVGLIISLLLAEAGSSADAILLNQRRREIAPSFYS